jgi:hypothetical protein
LHAGCIDPVVVRQHDPIQHRRALPVTVPV